MKSFWIGVMFLLFQTMVNAQVIKGRVLEFGTDSTIANASIYFDGMFKGTSSDKQGNFTLNISGANNAPIIISSVGYSSAIVPEYSANKSLKIYLQRKITELDEVVISFNDGMSRKEKLAVFRREFLGATANGRSCEILNEDDIQFVYIKSAKTIKAFCDKPIIIRNRNLGYKITYFLENFSYTDKTTILNPLSSGRGIRMSPVTNIEFFYKGNYYFEDEVGSATRDYEKVKQRRENAYGASRMHFIRSLWNNSIAKSGFDVYTMPYKEVTFENLVVSHDTLKYIRPSNKEAIFIHSKGNGESSIELTRDSVYISKNGFYDEGIVWGGEMMGKRIGDLLPYEYGSSEPANTSPSMQTVAVADSNILKIMSFSDTLLDRFPQEKVHLHLDKPYYSIGDTIWLKAYVVNAERNELSDMSKVLYVDLVNERDSVKYFLRLPLYLGTASGDIILTDTLKEGNYRIRAYTNWMRNFGDEFFFDKTIPIGNSLSANLVAKAAYTISKINNTEDVMVEISYHDLSGKPTAGKEVSYEIQPSLGKTIKGKSTTDDSGIIKIQFNAPEFSTGKINTTIKLDNKISLLKEIPFRGGSQPTIVKFFPESGQLVNGISSKVAFKAVGGDGLSKEISGYITDKDNKVVTEFKSEHAGMGSFIFQPQASNLYTATIKREDGTEQKTSLPAISGQGHVLSVTKDAENLFVRAEISKELLGGEVVLVGQSNGVIRYLAKKKAETTVLNVTIPQSRFPEGILQLTLFSSGSQPVAERLVFILKESNRLKLNLNTDKPVYQKREKVSMDLTITDEEGNPAQGSFSLAVTDEEKVPYQEERETTIFSNLLLSSDLKGYIEQPNYYFTNTSSDKSKQLDNLLLAQGWRRFVWKEVLAGKTNALAYKVEVGMSISGRVTNLNGKEMAGRKVSILFTGATPFILDTVAGSDGHFRFDNLVLSNTDRFTIRTADAKGNNEEVVRIEIDQIYSEKVSIQQNQSALNDDSFFLTYLRNSRDRFDEMKQSGTLHGVALKEVTITAKKKTLQEEVQELAVRNSSNMNGPGSADQVITFMDIQDCSNLYNCLAGRIMGVKLVKTGTGEVYASSLQTPGRNMLLVLDGVPSGYDLNTVSPFDIDAIEVLRFGGKLAIYGFSGAYGIIVITTKRGGIDYQGYANEKYRPGYLEARKVKSYQLQGYNFAREFYSPDYANPATNTQMADLRTTVYWNPSIITDANGKAKVEFYNADGTGNYRIITEGLAEDGKLGRLIYRYNVK